MMYRIDSTPSHNENVVVSCNSFRRPNTCETAIAPMPNVEDYLRVLGLDSCESATQLAAAYRREMLKWHPDRFHSDPAMKPVATKRAKHVNAAFEYLSELLENGYLPRSTPRANTASTSKRQHEYCTRHTYDGKPFTPGFGNLNIHEVFVKSSAIISTGYDRANETLYVKFKNDRVYAYLHVPESVFSALLAAESKGKFLHRHVFSRYKCESVS
jgi:hypothetical protein